MRCSFKKEHEFYHSYSGEKTHYTNYIARIRKGVSMEDAITTKRLTIKPKTKWRDDGRVCTYCKEFKPWSEFRTDVSGPHGHTSRCRRCLMSCGYDYYHKKHKTYKPKLVKETKYIQGDDTVSDAVQEIIDRIGILPPKLEEWE